MAEGGNSVSGGTQHGLVQASRIGEVNQYFHFGGQDDTDPGHQLPLDNGVFENRRAQTDRVWRELDERAKSAPLEHPLVVTFTGVSGIGKTALVVHLAHQMKDRFRAAYIDLDEWRTDGSVDHEALLRHLLRWLGVRDGRPSSEYRQLVGQYRGKTQGARLVLALDNVWSADEIRTLLPVSAEAVVLVASQERLSGLESHVTHELALGPLSPEHGSAVLRRLSERVRPDESAQTLVPLARLCDGFPIALQVAGQLLFTYPRRRLERIVADLTADLYEKGLPVVEAVWNAAYATLDPPAARLYRLMPHHPGYDITLDAATALLGTGLDDGEDGLDGLTNAGLLALSPRAGRWRTHSLLRAHAVRCAHRYGDPAETEEGMRRLLLWYRRQAERADRTLGAERMRMAEPVPELPYAPDVPFASAAEAGAWLDTERKALYGLVRIAGDLGEDTHAWSLCEPLWKHYEDHGHHEDAIRAFQTGRDCAQRDGAAQALIRMRCQLAQALWKAGRAADADAETRQAVLSAESVVPGEKLHASALEFRGKYLAWHGRPDEAVPYFQRSRDIHLTIGNPYGVLLQGFLAGRTLRAAGRPAEAEAELEAARRLAVDQDRVRMIGRTAAELARTHRALGRTAEAVAAYEEALVHERARGSVHDQIALHDELAAVTEESGDPEAAGRHRARARELRAEAGIESDHED
ncbi:NB-ARC domain-containing protein [Streptomyces lushanensis]|uniref:NB-ARC domain-containing protein n=1 Tax=Streptomyces lushanensis TaxID=1434255 RepID=UPI00099F5C42|nr:NB-ARC domain-containing protein [Streptomyces lushanensis]